MFSVLFLVSALVSSIAAVPNPEVPLRRSALPTTWFHKRDHPVHDLFRRDAPPPTVGSPEWVAQYPSYGIPVNASMPASWLAALQAAEAANLIPQIAPSTTPDGSTIVYPPNANAGQEPICSASYQCRHPEDVWDAPDGMMGLAVDDGPVSDPTASSRLYDFLQQQNQIVTHFMIGLNILASPDVFLRAFQQLGNDIGVHTWTHPHCSLLTNEEILGELGWTMQIIYDSTGGRVPRYWRPPYGDADNRVRAIAKYVFGLTTVVWNQDSQDWTMASNGTTLDAIQAAFTGWLNGPRTPGLIVLEHEITGDDVTAFLNMYPLIAAAGGGAPWQAMSIAQLFDGHASGTHGTGWYRNSQNNTAVVTQADILNVTSTSSSAAGGPTGGGGGGAPTTTPTTTRSGARRAAEGGVGLVGAMAIAVLLAASL